MRPVSNAAQLADAYTAAGRAFLGDLVDPAERYEALQTALGVDGMVAAQLVAKVDIRGPDSAARGAMANALVHALRFTDGVALRTLRSATALSVGMRPGFDVNAGALSAEPARALAVQHEVGHALEFARPELNDAAVAFRARRAMSSETFSLSDLKVIQVLAQRIGPDAQRLMLEQLIDSPYLAPFDSAERLKAAFGHLGYDDAIDAFARDGELVTSRPYAPDELAFPMLGDPYVGRYYNDTLATEVVSLGFEKLTDARWFMYGLQNDPELVAFMVGALLTKA